VKPRKQRYPLGFFLAMLASLMFFASIHTPSPIFPLFAIEDIRTDEAGWGMASALVAWFAMAFRLPAGALADRVGRRRVMAIGGGLSVLSWVLLAFARSFGVLVLQRALTGITIAAFATSYKALVVDLAPPDRRGEAIGLGNLTFSGALIGASPLGEAIAAALGYRAVFLASGGFAALALVFLLPLREPPAASHREPLWRGAADALRRREVQIGVGGMLGVSAAFVGVFTYLPLWAASRGITQGVGTAFSVLALADLVAQPIGGWLGDRISRRWVMGPGMLMAAGGMMLISNPVGALPLCMYVGVILMAVGMAFTRVNLDMLAQASVPHHLRGTAAAIEYAFFDVWNGVFGWGMGVLAVRAGYSAIYVAGAGVCLVWAIGLWLLAPRRAAAQPESTVSAVFGASPGAND
jgi:predicted MFS family arabinose efflux permease